MSNHDLVVIGGGPAGMAAAISAYDAGVKDILILERDIELGGILNQCVHNGFGLHTFKEELTGPEYAARYIEMLKERPIQVELGACVLSLTKDKVITVLSKEHGLQEIQARAVVLAMGCRERPRGALNIPGYRPAGVFSAGTAQRLVNREGYTPGKKVVILGSGDIGLIMARRMTLEGAEVLAVAEILPYSSGLKRNIVQCLDDFNIPLYLSHTVSDIQGKDRVEAVTLSQVDEHMQPIPGTEKEYECDTLLLSCGLIPENELSEEAGIDLSPRTRGAVVDNTLETSVPGIFSCGNVLHVHDLVDQVSEEATLAGFSAAEYLKQSSSEKPTHAISVNPGDGVSYTVPSTIYVGAGKDQIIIRFRVRGIYKNAAIVVRAGDTELRRQKKRVMVPAEMQNVLLKQSELANVGDTLTISIEEEA